MKAYLGVEVEHTLEALTARLAQLVETREDRAVLAGLLLEEVAAALLRQRLVGRTALASRLRLLADEVADARWPLV